MQQWFINKHYWHVVTWIQCLHISHYIRRWNMKETIVRTSYVDNFSTIPTKCLWTQMIYFVLITIDSHYNIYCNVILLKNLKAGVTRHMKLHKSTPFDGLNVPAKGRVLARCNPSIIPCKLNHVSHLLIRECHSLWKSVASCETWNHNKCLYSYTSILRRIRMERRPCNQNTRFANSSISGEFWLETFSTISENRLTNSIFKYQGLMVHFKVSLYSEIQKYYNCTRI